MKVTFGESVFSESIQRIRHLYEQGHRVVVSFSGGKDSGVCLELCIIAARETGNLPVEVVMRDEEIMYPGTFEYSQRMYDRKETDFHWLVAHQPIINVFDRKVPYWWVFDRQLEPEEWVRQPPSFAEYIKEQNIIHMADTKRFPVEKGKYLIHIIGLRTSESRRRAWAISSMKSFMTKPFNKKRERNANPIYDWKDSDVWKALRDNKWDYNHAYNVMYRLGLPPSRLRIAPPTLVRAGLPGLKLAARAWPQWFTKVCKRLPGIRAVVRFGLKVISPHRRLGESWEECYKRECLTDAPSWIIPRAQRMMERMLSRHAHHSSTPFPQVERCKVCSRPGSWRELATMMYMGNPFSLGGCSEILPYVEPETFREGAGKWGGKPTW